MASAREAKTPTLGFLGWFGPRGLASIVFAVIGHRGVSEHLMKPCDHARIYG